MERYLAIKTAARFLTRIYTDENNWDNSALAAILKAEGDEDTATLSQALDGVIAFCNELKGNLKENADKRLTRNENEDERTRKELIEFIYTNTLSIDERHSRWIAWLEKQVSPQMVADAYLRGCNDTEKKWLEKQGKQEWTEEDELIRKSLLNEFIHLQSKGCNKFAGLENEDIITWLKSIKERYN